MPWRILSFHSSLMPWARTCQLITAIVSMPFTFFMSNDAFYFGVLPHHRRSRFRLRNRRR